LFQQTYGITATHANAMKDSVRHQKEATVASHPFLSKKALLGTPAEIAELNCIFQSFQDYR
jgi:hypothetical protein